METGKTGKYLKYAIGEVILVMIGILLALQVNNWNTNRLQKQKEQILLTALNKEFKTNKTQLDSVLFYHKSAMKSNEYLLSRLPIMDVRKENLDSLGYHIWGHTATYTFNPSSGVTSSIMNSSSINIISNIELRQLLIRWNDLLLDYQEEEILARENYHNLLKPYEKKHFLFTDKDMLKDSRVDLSFLTSLEFDNYVLDRKNDIDQILENSARELEAIIISIDKIIELSEPKNND
jgi:Family of unknown function (DUF6090)